MEAPPTSLRSATSPDSVEGGMQLSSLPHAVGEMSRNETSVTTGRQHSAHRKIWVARFDGLAQTLGTIVTVQAMDQTGLKRTTGISRFVLDWYTS